MSSPIRVLELRSVRGRGGGPEKTILHGAAQADSSQLAVTVCYLRDARDPVFGVDAEARRLQIDYVEVVERHSFDLRAWRDIRWLLRERRIDIVHAHEYKTDLIARWLAHTEDVVTVATAHGWTGKSGRERFYYACDRRLLRGFDRVIAVSSEIAAVLARAGVMPARLRTIVNAIDPSVYRRDPSRRNTERATLGLQPDDFVIGSVGRVERQKRFDVLLHAIAQVRLDLGAHVRLLIAGSGSLDTELRELAQRLGLGGGCRLLGQWQDIIGLHHALDLYVQASEYEGTANALLEAMALKTPIVATNVGGTSDLIRDQVDGLLVASDDPRALAGAIEQCMKDPDTAVRRCAAARQRVENELSFERRQQTLHTMYLELVAERV